MANQVIGGDYLNSKIDVCSLKHKHCISLFPKRYGIGEISLVKGDVTYTLISQEDKKATGGAFAGALLGGLAGAVVGTTIGSSTMYTLAIEYVRGGEKKKSLIEIDSRLYKIFIASMF